MTEKFYHPILTALGPFSEEFEKELDVYLSDFESNKKPYFLITEDEKLHIMAPFNFWALADGTIPEGVFMATVRYITASGVRFESEVLEGRQGKTYDYKTGEPVHFHEARRLTHYMPKPMPAQVAVAGVSIKTREAEMAALGDRLEFLRREADTLRRQMSEKGKYLHTLKIDSPEFVACRDEIRVIVERLARNKKEQADTIETMALLFDSINNSRAAINGASYLG